jgi:hypothetical protein
MPVTEHTGASFTAYVAEHWGKAGDTVFGKVAGWLARGDGAAIYENQDLGHPELGSCQIVSYGSPAAQLEPFCGLCQTPLDPRPGWVPGSHPWVHQGNAEGHEPDYPPERLPDIGGKINWRYVLVGTYRGNKGEDHDG